MASFVKPRIVRLGISTEKPKRGAPRKQPHERWYRLLNEYQWRQRYRGLVYHYKRLNYLRHNPFVLIED